MEKQLRSAAGVHNVTAPFKVERGYWNKQLVKEADCSFVESGRTRRSPSANQSVTYMLQAFLLELLYGGVFGHFLQPLRALHSADVDLQHFPCEYLLFLHEHGS